MLFIIIGLGIAFYVIVGAIVYGLCKDAKDPR